MVVHGRHTIQNHGRRETTTETIAITLTTFTISRTKPLVHWITIAITLTNVTRSKTNPRAHLTNITTERMERNNPLTHPTNIIMEVTNAHGDNSIDSMAKITNSHAQDPHHPHTLESLHPTLTSRVTMHPTTTSHVRHNTKGREVRVNHSIETSKNSNEEHQALTARQRQRVGKSQ